MVIVYCLLRRCLRNLNGICTRRRVYISEGRCTNFRPRVRETFSAYTKVICDKLTCRFNMVGLCTKTEVYLTSTSCEGKPKESEGNE